VHRQRLHIKVELETAVDEGLCRSKRNLSDYALFNGSEVLKQAARESDFSIDSA
jgi:hypothetical protein